jgi:hypothetical protein
MTGKMPVPPKMPAAAKLCFFSRLLLTPTDDLAGGELGTHAFVVDEYAHPTEIVT